MSDVTGNPPAGEKAEDSGAIRAMREQLEAANRQAKAAEEAKAALEARLTEIERKDMDEKQRLAAELEDAKKAAAEAERLRNEHGQFTSTFEKLYNDRLSAIPEEKRADLQAISKSGDWSSRFDALEAGIRLLGVTAVPARGGTTTNPDPATPPSPEPPKPLSPSDLARTSMGSVIAARMKKP